MKFFISMNKKISLLFNKLNFNELHYIILINFLLLSYFILVSFKPIPDSTHYLVSFLNEDDKSDLINWAILFIKTPFYQFFGNVFQSPNKYIVCTYLINFIFINLIFFILFRISKNIFISFFVVCTIIFFKFLEKVSISYSLGFFDFFNHFIINADILKIFTVRQFFGIVFLLSIFFFLNKRYYTTILLLFLNNFTHPNSNLFCILIFSTLFFLKSINDKENFKYFLILLISNSIFFTSLFFKIKNYPDINLQLDYSYYTYLIKDEADDFSFLWLLSYKLNYFLIITSIHILNLYFYFKKIKKFDDLILFNLIPIVFFLLGSIIEFINIKIDFHLIDVLIINTQPSWKLLGYSFFPFLIVLMKNFEQLNLFNNLYFKNYIFLFVVFTIIIFLTVGSTRNYKELKNYFIYSLNTNFEENFEDWRKAYSEFNSYNYFPMLIENTSIKMADNYASERNIFKLKKTFDYDEKQTFVEKYDFEDGYNLIKAIKKNISKKNGIIVPPYIFNLRGTLKDHYLFFLEHPDGNWAMGNFKFFKPIHKRMEHLFGFGYEKFPNKQSGLNTSFMRQEYLKLSEEKLIKINNEYPNYNYFVTEKTHVLDLNILYEDNSFIIYRIK